MEKKAAVYCLRGTCMRRSSIHYQAGDISRSKAATAHSKHAFWVSILLIKYCVLQATAGGKDVIEIPLTFQPWSAQFLFPQRRRQMETEGERRWSSTKKTLLCCNFYWHSNKSTITPGRSAKADKGFGEHSHTHVYTHTKQKYTGRYAQCQTISKTTDDP